MGSGGPHFGVWKFALAGLLDAAGIPTDRLEWSETLSGEQGLENVLAGRADVAPITMTTRAPAPRRPGARAGDHEARHRASRSDRAKQPVAWQVAHSRHRRAGSPAPDSRPVRRALQRVAADAAFQAEAAASAYRAGGFESCGYMEDDSSSVASSLLPRRRHACTDRSLASPRRRRAADYPSKPIRIVPIATGSVTTSCSRRRRTRASSAAARDRQPPARAASSAPTCAAAPTAIDLAVYHSIMSFNPLTHESSVRPAARLRASRPLFVPRRCGDRRPAVGPWPAARRRSPSAQLRHAGRGLAAGTLLAWLNREWTSPSPPYKGGGRSHRAHHGVQVAQMASATSRCDPAAGMPWRCRQRSRLPTCRRWRTGLGGFAAAVVVPAHACPVVAS